MLVPLRGEDAWAAATEERGGGGKSGGARGASLTRISCRLSPLSLHNTHTPPQFINDYNFTGESIFLHVTKVSQPCVVFIVSGFDLRLVVYRGGKLTK